MNNMTCTQMVIDPSEKQLRMITALRWELRPYYLWQQWHMLETMLNQILRTATRGICDRLIKRMLAALAQKREGNAKKVWLPMDYRVTNTAWQRNITKMAGLFFPEETESFADLDPNDCTVWRELKNRVEREEMKRSCEFVPDEFEDTRFAESEAERWRLGKRSYAELIEGVDFLEPTPGIDC